MALMGHHQVARGNRGRVSGPRIAALSGSQIKAPGFAGGYLLSPVSAADATVPLSSDVSLDRQPTRRQTSAV